MRGLLKRIGDVLGFIGAVPLLRRALQALLGHSIANLFLLLPTAMSVIAAFGSSTNSLDLAAAGVKAVNLFTESSALRAA
jgi:hypothetical protein